MTKDAGIGPLEWMAPRVKAEVARMRQVGYVWVCWGGIWRKFCMRNFRVSAMGENNLIFEGTRCGLKGPRETSGL